MKRLSSNEFINGRVTRPIIGCVLCTLLLLGASTMQSRFRVHRTALFPAHLVAGMSLRMHPEARLQGKPSSSSRFLIKMRNVSAFCLYCFIFFLCCFHRVDPFFSVASRSSPPSALVLQHFHSPPTFVRTFHPVPLQSGRLSGMHHSRVEGGAHDRDCDRGWIRYSHPRAPPAN